MRSADALSSTGTSLGTARQAVGPRLEIWPVRGPLSLLQWRGVVRGRGHRFPEPAPPSDFFFLFSRRGRGSYQLWCSRRRAEALTVTVMTTALALLTAHEMQYSYASFFL